VQGEALQGVTITLDNGEGLCYYVGHNSRAGRFGQGNKGNTW
jgi:hypothetical protein